MTTLLLLLPDLSLIVLGAVLYRALRWGDGFWAGLERLVYYVLFPALLFNSIARYRFDLGEAAPFAGAVLAIMALGITLGYVGGILLRPTPRRFASGVQCAFRFNSYVTLALAQRLGGDAGVAWCAIAVAIAVPVGNIAAVYPLARHAGTGIWREMLRNPLILATVSGLAASLVGLQLPEPVSALLSRLGNAALALGLLTVGAGLRLTGVAGDRPFAIYATSVKLVAMPLAALAAGPLLGLPPLAWQILVLFASMPTASASYILASRMGGDGPYVALLITVSTLTSLAALPFWLSWVL
ncbi:MAG TPA: AEC family transporter [Burkholderiaceae bacterium]|nr:AEC family transporter [Burkholderiaceae bacterium]